jgi:hypothetical protein
MYSVFARSKVPGANTAVAEEVPVHHHDDLVAK